MSARRFRGSIATAVLLSVALRIPFLTTPLNADEGGYATIAVQWARGARLYHDVWVDRPQAMLVLYRLTFATLGVHPWAVRLVAAIWAAGGVLAVAAAGRSLGGRRVGAVAAFVFALASATPRAEGFAANGELLAAVPSAACVALALGGVQRLRRGSPPASAPAPAGVAASQSAPSAARRTDRRAGLLVAAGASGGLAVTMKQSGFDGALAVGVWLAVAGLRRWLSWRALARAAVPLGAGAAAVLGVAVLHGSTVGLDAWWFAVVGERSSRQSVWVGSLGDRAARLWRMTRILWPVLTGGAVLLAAGLLGRRDQRDAAAGGDGRFPGVGLLVGAWLAAALAGFAVGGLFHPHYVIGLAPSFSVAAALALRRAARRRPALAGGAVAVALGLFIVSSWPALSASSAAERSRRSTADWRVLTDERVGAYIRAHTAPGEGIYAMYANAGLYFAADRRPVSPYLWGLNLEQVPGATEQLAAAFAGDDPPRYVARYFPVDALPGADSIAASLARRYREETVIDGVTLYRLVD